jgi:KaiC/GvpD/RAD55 family RecA-like ATPase
MREQHVLASCVQSRDAFQLVADHVNRDDLSEQGWIIWQGVANYYDSDTTAKTIDPAILGDQVARGIAVDKHKETFVHLCNGLGEFEVSPANVVGDLIETKKEVIEQRLGAAFAAKEDTRELLDEYERLQELKDFEDEDKPEIRQGLSVEDLVNTGFTEENLITIMPEPLNDRLDGGVKPGHHIVLFARPEMGKTMMVIEMMAGFLDQGLKVLYIGNEDPINDINMRVVNRLSGMTKLQVLNKPREADRKARERGYENLVLYSAAPGTKREITRLIESVKPHALVIDQLRNIDMNDENYVLALEKAAKAARQWAKRYSCVVVSVTQAGDSADRKNVLDIGDVDFSNTGIPAQADVMVGLGANDQLKQRGEICISLPKNKVSGRHEYFTVLAQPALSKVTPLA